MTRYGMTIRLKPECIDVYRSYHAAVWPEVLNKITECGIRTYSIFLKDSTLFGYFEYHGSDFAADMARWPPTPRRRSGGPSWSRCSNPSRQSPGRMWANMEEVFHLD